MAYSTMKKALKIGMKVTGTYFGVSYRGVVTNICWGWREDNIYVTLDYPIVVMDTERTEVLVSESCGTCKPIQD